MPDAVRRELRWLRAHAYAGRSVERAAVLRLSDPNGRPRIQLSVDSLGTPSLEFLGDYGQVIQRLPSR